MAFSEEIPLEIGSRKQLFIDQRFIARSERLTLRTNPGQKLGQILDADGKTLMEHPFLDYLIIPVTQQRQQTQAIVDAASFLCEVIE